MVLIVINLSLGTSNITSAQPGQLHAPVSFNAVAILNLLNWLNKKISIYKMSKNVSPY